MTFSIIMQSFKYSCLIFFLLFCVVEGDQIDNGLLEDPTITCGGENILINIRTKKPFEGHVYVKGHYSLKQCRSDATLEPRVNLSISYSECNVVRQRSSNPKGLMMSAMVIVSFHPMFITKIDRSYKVQCFYTESSRSVTRQLTVDIAKEQEKRIFVMVGDDNSVSQSQFARDSTMHHNKTSTININVPLPICQYKVLNAEKTEEVTFAKVGQIVYHEWACSPGSGNEPSPFCATVHSCNVNDETGKEVQIFDENGCAVDRYLINNLEYSSDLKGGQLSQVFKFADQPSVFFQCKIRLGLKNENGACSRSSDNCSVPLRGKRSVKNESNDNFDVVSQTVTVLDINERTTWRSKENENSQTFRGPDVCFSLITASGLFVVFSFVSVLCITLLIVFCVRHQTVNLKLAH